MLLLALNAPIVYAQAIGHFWLYAYLSAAGLGMLFLTLRLREEAVPV